MKAALTRKETRISQSYSIPTVVAPQKLWPWHHMLSDLSPYFYPPVNVLAIFVFYIVSDNVALADSINA